MFRSLNGRMENLLIVYSIMEFGIMEYLKTHIGKMEHG